MSSKVKKPAYQISIGWNQWLNLKTKYSILEAWIDKTEIPLNIIDTTSVFVKIDKYNSGNNFKYYVCKLRENCFIAISPNGPTPISFKMFVGDSYNPLESPFSSLESFVSSSVYGANYMSGNLEILELVIHKAMESEVSGNDWSNINAYDYRR